MKSILAALAVLSGMSLCYGAPPGWSVDEMVAQGLAKNPELSAYEAEVAAAKGERTQAGLWKNPDFSGEYGERRVTGSDGVNKGITRSASITQTFEFPGKGSLRKAIADKNVEIAELGLRQFRLALAGQIRSLAFQYQAASAEADAAAEVRERSQALIRLLGERPTAGVVSFLERRVIEASLIDLGKSAKEFGKERDEAGIELNRLLGLPVSQPLRMAPLLAAPSRLPESDKVVLDGLGGNFLLKTRTAELEKAVRSVSAAKLDAFPNFSVGPFFSQDRAGDNEENFGGSLSVTLPLWNWNQGNIAAARARKEQADALLADARRKVESEILRRLRSLERTRTQLDATPETAVDDLRKAADVADRQYRAGTIPVQLFLETQKGYLTALQVRQEALVESWKDRLDLELLTGGAQEAK